MPELALESLLPVQIELPAPPAPLVPKSLPGHGAVFALLDAEGRLIQLLSTQDLRRAVMQRLQQPAGESDPDTAGTLNGPPAAVRTRRPELRSVVRFIRWQPTYSVFESALHYLRVARALMPRNYREQLGFGPIWFARVDPDERLPRWSASPTAYNGNGFDAGPFDRRSLCTDFIQMLEDAFELCRYYDILEQTPHGVPCAYFEMGKCPAPCNGSISLDQYRAIMRESAALACSREVPGLERWHTAMQDASRALQFERAAGLKQTIDRIRKLLDHPGRLGGSAEDFKYLVVQRGAKPSLLRPFFVDRGVIESGDDTKVSGIEQAVPNWIARLQTPNPLSSGDALVRSEHVWLVSHFLIKGTAAPGLFVHHSALKDASEFTNMIRQRFEKPSASIVNSSETLAEP